MKSQESKKEDEIFGAYQDEISVSDLVLIIWRNKIVGISVAIVVMMIALSYLLIAKPVYKADTHFLPPTRQKIEALNVAKQYDSLQAGAIQYSALGYDIDEVYQEFIRQLNSLALRREFFNRNNLLNYYSPDDEVENANVVFNKAFNPKLIVSSPGKGENSIFRTISFEMGDAEKSALILNQFVEFVAGETKGQLVGNVRNNIAAEITKLETLIKSKRDLAEQRRQDMVAQLEEALRIAKKLNIQKMADYSREYEAHEQLDDSGSVAVNTVELPLYTRGVLALEAEIEALKERKSDDPYIDGLRDAQERLNTLRALVVDPQAIEVVTIDSSAVTPAHPERPKKTVVLAAGIFLALFLGMVAGFLTEFVKGLRQRLKVTEVKD